MKFLATPGLYRQPVEPSHKPGPLARGDVAVILGYAARGPVRVPVRLQSLSQFEEVFGPALPHGFLWHGLKGFFECGGQAAYVIRVTDDTARAATVGLGAGWTATASFPWPLVDPRNTNSASRPDTAIWLQRVDEEIRKGGPRRDDPGGWGNQLTLEISRASRVVTRVAEVLDAHMVRFASFAGLEAASVLEFAQTSVAATVIGHALPVSIEPTTRLVRFAAGLDGLGLDLTLSDGVPLHDITVTSVEFDLTVGSRGRTEQTFTRLSPNPAHSQSIAKVMGPNCRLVSVAGPAAADWAKPKSWPAEGFYTLAGGLDGLTGVGGASWDAALAQIATLNDAALIAAPDITLPAAGLPPAEDQPGLEPSCTDISPHAPGFLDGIVTTLDDDGASAPVPGVLVDVAGVGGSATTDADGKFSLSGVSLALALVTLRLSKQGFEFLETEAQARSFAGMAVERFVIQRITNPAVLPPDEVLRLQQALGNPAIVGPYKVAVVDPPTSTITLEELISWRAELGDQPRLGLFAPWLSISDDAAVDGRLALPPSGHVCGAFAKAELAGGIHLTGANLALRYVEGTKLAIDDAAQAGLNPIGINAIRAFPGRGIRAYGTRSLAADPSWTYLTARRIVDSVEKTLERSLAWMVFEPNSALTRHAVQTTTETFLDQLFRQGVLAGSSPNGAYQAKCDYENNPQDQVDNGQLVLDVALAPTVPFEFILFRIGNAFDAVQVTEKV